MISRIALMGMAAFAWLKKSHAKLEWTAGITSLKKPKPFATNRISDFGCSEKNLKQKNR